MAAPQCAAQKPDSDLFPFHNLPKKQKGRRRGLKTRDNGLQFFWSAEADYRYFTNFTFFFVISAKTGSPSWMTSRSNSPCLRSSQYRTKAPPRRVQQDCGAFRLASFLR
jgi:hypothetical protein